MLEHELLSNNIYSNCNQAPNSLPKPPLTIITKEVPSKILLFKLCGTKQIYTNIRFFPGYEGLIEGTKNHILIFLFTFLVISNYFMILYT